jgi:hypothetical protein
VLKVIQVVKTERHIDVDENDLIAVAEASRISGRTISAIIGMMEAGSLPWYQLAFGNEQRKRVPKFTSRRAVEALPVKKVSGPTKKKAKG